MVFQFRYETVLKQRKAEQDVASREYHEAQAAVQTQMTKIKRMYALIDEARERAEEMERSGGKKAQAILQIEEFIGVQKIAIQRERDKARELMAVAEEKLEVLTEKMQAFKILEKLKEKKKTEFRKEQNKRWNKEADDLTVMRTARRVLRAR